MKKHIALLTLFAFASGLSACSQKQTKLQKDTETGLDYAIVTTGSGELIQEGDAVTFNLKQICTTLSGKDSVLANSYENGQPADVIVQAASFPGDIIGLFPKFRQGDSVIISYPVDSLVKVFGALPPFIQPGSNLVYNIKIETVKSQAAMEAEREAALEEYIQGSGKVFEATESGLLYCVNMAGKGEKIKFGNNVKLHYTGKLLDGNTFDSSVERGEPMEFVFNDGMFIPGWIEALQMMKKGQKMTIVVPPTLGYGARPMGPIPANSTLVFDVEILDVTTPKTK